MTTNTILNEDCRIRLSNPQVSEFYIQTMPGTLPMEAVVFPTLLANVLVKTDGEGWDAFGSQLTGFAQVPAMYTNGAAWQVSFAEGRDENGKRKSFTTPANTARLEIALGLLALLPDMVYSTDVSKTDFVVLNTEHGRTVAFNKRVLRLIMLPRVAEIVQEKLGAQIEESNLPELTPIYNALSSSDVYQYNFNEEKKRVVNQYRTDRAAITGTGANARKDELRAGHEAHLAEMQAVFDTYVSTQNSRLVTAVQELIAAFTE